MNNSHDTCFDELRDSLRIIETLYQRSSAHLFIHGSGYE
jgi:hypothetical protein